MHALHLVYNFKTPANVQETSAEVRSLSSHAALNLGVVTKKGEYQMDLLKFIDTADFSYYCNGSITL